MKFKYINQWSGLLVVFWALAACGHGGPGDRRDAGDQDSDSATLAVPVEAAQATREAITASYSGTASLEAENQAQVVAKTSGVLIKLYIEEGQRVSKGQLLAQLDPERPQLQAAQAEANLKRLENDFRRSQEMYAAKLTSSEAHDRIRFDLETQRATYDMAKLELSYTRIVAPIDGVISQRMVKEGNLIQLHQALFRIDDFEPLLAVLNVPERELNILQPGLDVAMNVDALPGEAFTGTVARVSPVVDPATGTFRVTCEFRDQTHRLKSGMFGRVSVVYDQRADALVVPREALAESDGKRTVFVVVKQRKSEYEREQREQAKARGETVPEEPKPETDDGGRASAEAGVAENADPELSVARTREVEVGYVAGDAVEIRSGLAEGDTVITVGRAGVRDGTVISILESVK